MAALLGGLHLRPPWGGGFGSVRWWQTGTGAGTRVVQKTRKLGQAVGQGCFQTDTTVEPEVCCLPRTGSSNCQVIIVSIQSGLRSLRRIAEEFW